MQKNQRGYLLISLLAIMSIVSVVIYTLLENNVVIKKVVENYHQEEMLAEKADALLGDIEKNHLHDNCSVLVPCVGVSENYNYRYSIENIFHDDCAESGAVDYLQTVLVVAKENNSGIYTTTQSIVVAPSDTSDKCNQQKHSVILGHIAWFRE